MAKNGENDEKVAEYHRKLFEFAQDGKWVDVEEEIERNEATFANTCVPNENDSKRTLLHYACRTNDRRVATSAVENLFEKFGELGIYNDEVESFVNLQDSTNEAALHLAVEKGNHDVIDILLAKGANIWMTFKTDTHVNENYQRVLLRVFDKGLNLQADQYDETNESLWVVSCNFGAITGGPLRVVETKEKSSVVELVVRQVQDGNDDVRDQNESQWTISLDLGAICDGLDAMKNGKLKGHLVINQFGNNQISNGIAQVPNVNEPVGNVNEKVGNVNEQVPIVNEPAATVNEPAATVNEPAPTAKEPAPTLNKPDPTLNEPTPTLNKPDLTVNEPAPTVNVPALIAEPAPIVNELQTTLHEPQKTVHEPQNTVNEPAVIVIEPASIVNVLQETVNEPAVIGIELTPIVNEPQKIVNEPDVIVTEPAPIENEQILNAKRQIPNENVQAPTEHIGEIPKTRIFSQVLCLPQTYRDEICIHPLSQFFVLKMLKLYQIFIWGSIWFDLGFFLMCIYYVIGARMNIPTVAITSHSLAIFNTSENVFRDPLSLPSILTQCNITATNSTTAAITSAYIQAHNISAVHINGFNATAANSTLVKMTTIYNKLTNVTELNINASSITTLNVTTSNITMLNLTASGTGKVDIIVACTAVGVQNWFPVIWWTWFALSLSTGLIQLWFSPCKSFYFYKLKTICQWTVLILVVPIEIGRRYRHDLPQWAENLFTSTCAVVIIAAIISTQIQFVKTTSVGVYVLMLIEGVKKLVLIYAVFTPMQFVFGIIFGVIWPNHPSFKREIVLIKLLAVFATGELNFDETFSQENLDQNDFPLNLALSVMTLFTFVILIVLPVVVLGFAVNNYQKMRNDATAAQIAILLEAINIDEEFWYNVKKNSKWIRQLNTFIVNKCACVSQAFQEKSKNKGSFASKVQSLYISVKVHLGIVPVKPKDIPQGIPKEFTFHRYFKRIPDQIKKQIYINPFIFPNGYKGKHDLEL